MKVFEGNISVQARALFEPTFGHSGLGNARIIVVGAITKFN